MLDQIQKILRDAKATDVVKSSITEQVAATNAEPLNTPNIQQPMTET